MIKYQKDSGANMSRVNVNEDPEVWLITQNGHPNQISIGKHELKNKKKQIP